MPELKIGDKAPGFREMGREQGKKHRGKILVLYFYPKDDTPGCTKEACSLRDSYRKLKKAGIEVIGVSPDSEESHKKFTKKHKLPFKLLADTDKKLAMQYGVWQKKNLYGKIFFGIKRTTFIIEKGRVRGIIEKVDTENHAEQIFEILENGS